MIRTQIQFTEVQSEALHRMAARSKLSVSELVRRGVTRLLDEERPSSPQERRRRAMSAVGGFRSGLRDVSRRHDRHLAEAYAERKE